MNRLDTLYDGARGLVSVMGDNVKHAGKWLDTGAKIGALKGGDRMATVCARRHPFLLAATVQNLRRMAKWLVPRPPNLEFAPA